MTRARKRRSAAWRGLALVLLSTVLVGLTVSASVGHARSTAASQTTLRIWYGSDDPTERPWAQELAQRFATRHRSVQVKLSFYSLDDIIAKTQLALSAGNPPDLIYTTPRGPGLPAYVRAGRLRDLSAEARRRSWAGQLRPALLAEYNRLLAANGSKRDAGRIYGVPYVVAAVGILYNKDIFHTLHLHVPRSLSAFVALLPRLKRAGYTPIGFGNEDGWVGDDWWLTLVNAAVDPATLHPALRHDPSFTFTRAPFRQAGATLLDWANRGYFTPDFGGLDPQEVLDDFFGQGRTAMQLISSTENSQILSALRDKGSRVHNVGVFAFPSARAGQPPVMAQSGYAGWAIPRAAHNPADALDFIGDATSAATAQLLLAHGMLPAHRIDARTPRLAAPFQRDYINALNAATPGVYLDAAPVPNINATMEANIQLLLKNIETPEFLTRSLQDVYSSGGMNATNTRTDGEF